MSERMSEATKTVLLIIPLIAMSVFCGYRVGDKRGRAEMKRWQDDYYQFDLSKPVCNGERCIILPVSEWARLVKESFHPIPTSSADHQDYLCFGNCPPAPAPKPSKRKRKPKDSTSYVEGYHDATQYCLASMDRIKKQLDALTAATQPEVKPAPRDFTKCECKDYGMGLICTCPALNSIYFSGDTSMPAAKP